MEERVLQQIENAYPDWKQVSRKQVELDQVLIERTEGRVRILLERMLRDPRIHLDQSYANAVSVRRLGYNDHGPVHARIVTYNALKMLKLLHQRGVRVSLEEEQVGTYEDAQVAVALGAYLHDVGMGVARDYHEWYSVTLADSHIVRCLEAVYPAGHPMHAVVRAMAHEAIVGHMGRTQIHSIEAGVVLVADGSDMARGRARIPQMINKDPVVGDIHRYSASAVTRVEIAPGEEKPIRITVSMRNKTGLFQVEEVLMTKVKASPIMNSLEILALVDDEPPRFYLR